ncbi:protein of unknown function DUF632, partial [Dillenia turbinata]
VVNSEQISGKMGCVASRIDKEERVQICKERKKLMKRLVRFRGEFANAQLAYLRALKNTGVTLRQFTELDTLEFESTPIRVALPPSPPPPLPPSPPPPPPFSPDVRKSKDNLEENGQEESMEIDEDDSCTPPPPPVSSSSWDFWDPFGASSPQDEKSETVELAEEEKWEETNTEFQEEDQEELAVASKVVNLPSVKQQTMEVVDDNSSMMSWYTKDTADAAMVVWRNKKTLPGIMKELDDYFLKACVGGKGIAVLMDLNEGNGLLQQSFNENKRKRSNSAKVFTALSWTWSSKSLQFARDIVELCGPAEPCRPGAHCITIDKLYAHEQRLYKEVKEEEIIKVEHEKKSALLQKLEDEDHDWSKTDKTRLTVESLQSDIIGLQQSISRTCSAILNLITEELHPQLVALTSGLMHMWRTMYECHQVQNHISQQMSHLTNHQSMEPTTDYHRHATVQLQNEVTNWYSSFCGLLKSQRDYVRALCRWIQLTDCLVDDSEQSNFSASIRTLCEEWQHALEKLPEKVASEAIRSFLLAIHSIMLQQAEERNLKKKSEKLERRLQKEMRSLAEMENKLEGSFPTGEGYHNLSPKNPLAVKLARTEALRKRMEGEKAKYLNSVQVTGEMTLNNLQTSLPNVFHALMGFSGACAQVFESIQNQSKEAGGSL